MKEEDLVVNGGKPTCSGIMGKWPFFDDEDIEAVSAVLKSGKINYWTGNEIKSFEAEFAQFCDSKYCIAVSNGTIALELILRAYGIGPGDEVLVTPRTFVASANCVVLMGAKPVFVDVDLDSQNISPSEIEKHITPKTKAIIAVHLAGLCCDMDDINSIAQANNLVVIEDCAQAHGALYKGKKAGSLGDVAAFSFCQDKIITTGGEGGAITTDSEELWRKIWSLKDHGKSYERANSKDESQIFRWLNTGFGTNARMTEMQAVLGRNALKKIDSWLDSRREFAHELYEALKKYDFLRIPMPDLNYKHVYYRFYVFVKESSLPQNWSRDLIIRAISREGAPCFMGSCSEIYLEDAFVNSEFAVKERLPNAELLGCTAICFLTHHTLTLEDRRNIITAICKVLDVVAEGVREEVLPLSTQRDL